MVRKYLFLASVACGLTAAATQKEVAKYSDVVRHEAPAMKASDFIKPVKMQRNDGSVVRTPAKAASTSVEWKRPAGQFWGTGYSPDINRNGFYYTPLALRPWVEYTFENLSTATGTGTWTIQNWSNETSSWNSVTSRENSVKASYLLYERADAPRLSYRGQVTYPTQFYGQKTTYNDDPNNYVGYISVNPDYEIRFDTEYADDCNMAVSSHYWGLFSRNETERSGMEPIAGARGYEGMEDTEGGGCWFGTNAQGINAAATRFEKPDSPYLLNAVYWFYWYGQDIPKDIPLKAYVFKTVNDAKIETGTNSQGEEFSYEALEVGELIATSESFVPAAVFDNTNSWYNSVKFEFKEKNPVTGAENAYSLEIEDDITVIVTGFDADLGNGGYITSTVSLDEFDEGYGNLGFLGSLEESEDGVINYDLRAISDFFVNPLPKTVVGVLADVSYPWISPSYDYPSEVKLPNDGDTTPTEQGLQVTLQFASSSMTEDYEITYNGEDECDWFELVGLDDEMNVNQYGEEEFAGFTSLDFVAAPNPTDENRTCVVRISIPAASYEITFLQGSNNNAVEIVGVDKATEYFDLQGRRVANPDKGIYIKKAGNKTEKVIL